MAQPLDPYRTLGLRPGASADEIRRAYRRLAKAYHPDSAGEAALPRFLAIQAAYEILFPSKSARRPPAGTSGSAAARDPWRADPSRARAPRDPSSRRGASGTAGPRSPNPGGDGDAAGGSRTSGTRPPTRGPSERTTRGSGKGRSTNKATLGSTSYDAAEDEPFEPDWQGGTWYGASSGTYWTINPKEYADPRKHGPEYQRRARRRVDGVDGIDGADTEDSDAAPSFDGADFADADSETAAGAPRRSGFDGRWTYPDDVGADETRRPPTDEPGVAPIPDEPVAPAPTLGELADRLLLGRVGAYGRIVLAFAAWAPLGAAIAWLAGELSGCSRFTATCADPTGMWALLPSVVAFAVLAALPAVAGLLAGGTVGALALAVPAAVILSAGGASRQPDVASAIINGAFVIGYAAGIAFALVRRRRLRRVP
ncbi:MAG: J domain-containing protein [Chloroflexota bacterium]